MKESAQNYSLIAIAAQALLDVEAMPAIAADPKEIGPPRIKDSPTKKQKRDSCFKSEEILKVNQF